MDPVTHGLVGATAAHFFADEDTARTATIIGGLAALGADADVFLGSSVDPLLTLELHRQFTHSLVFIPAGGLIIALLLWWFVRKRLSFSKVWLFSTAGYATAGFMDYITSYGVQLLWPFTDERFALNIISVFDPLFTLVLMVLTGFALYKKRKLFPTITLTWIVLYLSFASFQQYRVLQATENRLNESSRSAQKLVIKPTMGNTLLWSVRYISDRVACSFGVRAGLLSEPLIYDGECVGLPDWKEEYASIEGTTMYNDIQRFSDLSDGFLIRHPEHPQVLGDGRFSMLPTSLSPLWGITIDTTATHTHARFDTYRNNDAETRSAFVDMLLGR